MISRDPWSLDAYEGNTITLIQAGLIKRVIHVLGLSTANRTRTPDPKVTLPCDLRQRSNYARIVRVFMDLAYNSRPDTEFVMHHYATHTHTQSHFLVY